MTLSKTVAPLLLLLGANLATPAQAEDLSIGFIAPMTGLFAQVGKDMNDGFQLYLDEHGNKLGGMNVKFILEDDQAKPDLGVTKAKKLILQDKVQHVHRRRAGLDRLRAGAGEHRRKNNLHRRRSRHPTISRNARPANIRI